MKCTECGQEVNGEMLDHWSKNHDVGPEYDITGGQRGKYAGRYAGGVEVRLVAGSPSGKASDGQG